MYGYTGKVLRIDLTSGKSTHEWLDKGIAMDFIGGSGLAAKILYDELGENIDPLSLDNKLIFATGPVTGTTLFSGRHCVAAKSPLTGIYGQATSGGYFGAELKFAGFDAIIVEGKADHPVYISIEDGGVEIKDATHLWGMDAIKTEKALKEELESETKVACIGPAGEDLVKFASIMNDGSSAAGRTGMGCVMGSKKLKAISVSGTKEEDVEIANEDKLRAIEKEVRMEVKRNPIVRDLGEHGTAGGAAALSLFGSLPTRYFKEGSFDGVNNIDGHAMTKTILKKRGTCYNCPVACKRIIEIGSGPYAGLSGKGPEYETCCALGALCLNDNLELIAKANDMCNRLGMDTISTGNIIAFCMECYERGLITKDKMDGIELDWGSAGMLDLIQRIGTREGIGDLLAEGVRAISKRIGAEDIAMHVKGLETPMFDPRALKGMAIVLSTSTRGACHMMGLSALIEMGTSHSSLHLPRLNRRTGEGGGKMVRILQDWATFMNSAIVCQLPLIRLNKGPDYCARMYSAVTGLDVDVQEMLEIGEKIFNLQRLLNVREGITREDDTLPTRFTEESHSKGSNKGQTVNLQPMLEEYYEARGWRDDVPMGQKI
jgi:aldehyde:ferredoxin oxidoreductase